MNHKILQAVRSELKSNINEKVKNNYNRFFKEPVKFYGVKTALVEKIVKKYWLEIKNKPKKEIFVLCEELFKSDYTEEAFIASQWVYLINKQFELNDFVVFENWIKKYINNWAKCDTFCNHSTGAFIEKYPTFIEQLKHWTKSNNRWLRRAAAVSLIVPARKGMFLKEVLAIADLLLLDPDDLVQKGYGWLLKEASRKHQQGIFNYVIKNKKRMPRTALRYAIEKMPPKLKDEAMEKKLAGSLTKICRY